MNLHFVRLNVLGGVERILTELVHRAALCDPEEAAFLLATSVHPFLQEEWRAHSCRAYPLKVFAGWFPVPRRPAIARDFRARWVARSVRPSRVISWNGINSRYPGVAASASGARLIHYEHGAAWNCSDDQGAHYLAGVDSVICISFAAKRLIQERWGYKGAVYVLPNVLLPSMLKTNTAGRPEPGGRKVVGAAGRLVPLKGFLSLVPMLRHLLDQGVDVEVQLAGTGPEAPAIRALAEKYGVTDRFALLGAVGDMSEFYQALDVFVVPSIREPFGLVALEASAYGLPVIGSAVDGIPEALSVAAGSEVVRPRLPLSNYGELGSSLRGVPTRVYDPTADCLVSPRAVDGAELADRIQLLLEAGVTVPPMNPSVVASRFSAYADTLKGLLSY